MSNNNTIDKKINSLEDQRAELYKKSTWAFPMALIFPIAVLIMTAITVPEAAMVMGGISAAFSAMIYYFLISVPFSYLKSIVRAYLLEEFMSIYHPNISYTYQPKKNQVKHIIRTSKLVSCNQYDEEDVIKGTANNINFYLSEINLKTTTGKSITTVFKGMLFKIKIPGRRFPSARIQSRPGLIKKMFGSFVEKPLFGFWYDTRESKKFEEELGPFFPFIRHLIQQQKDIRISTQGDEIT